MASQQQLPLGIDDSQLDERTREIGRRGLAEARAALEEAARRVEARAALEERERRAA